MASYQNNFIIGLGGAGGLSVAAFRRATVVRQVEYEAMTTSSPEVPEPARFEYLYIDSSVDQKRATSQWTAFGKDVSLPEDDYISIKSGRDTFVSAQNSPQVMGWLGEHKLIQPSQNSGLQQQEMDGAEQMRRFGRVLFALKASNISARVRDKISSLGNDITFHIFATLGGGTGSGSLIDLITLICKLCKDQAITHKVYLYLYVGGEKIPPTVNVGRFYENEYATLRDLNALMTNRYHPDMAAAIPPQKFLNITERPVNQIYVCSDMAPNRIGSGSIADQANFMAEACFDIIYSHVSGQLTGGPQRAFSGEDLFTDPENAAEDNGERSYRFAVLGTKRWCVPTDRIAELLQQLYQSLVLQYWLKGMGSSKDVQMRFDRSHVKHAPLLDLEEKMGTKNFTTAVNVDRYLTEKIRAVDAVFTKAQGSEFAPQTLLSLTNDVHTILERIAADFDDPEFLHTYDDDIKIDASTIAADFKVSLAMKREWRAGNQAWGLKDLRRCIKKFSQFVGDKRNACKSASIDPNQHGKMAERAGQWDKISLLSKLTPKVEQLLRAHQSEALGLVGNAVEALRQKVYARFYEALEKELSNMHYAINKCIEDMESKAITLEEGFTTVLNSLTNGANDTVYYDFDEENLRNVINFLRKDASAAYIEASMQEAETQCWAKVWHPTETTRYYSSDTNSTDHLPELYKKLQSDDCAWTLSRTLVENITSNEPEYKNVYHDSLYARLNERWSSKSETERKGEILNFTRKLCTSAGITPVAPLQNNEYAAPISALALGLPQDDVVGECRRLLLDTIGNNLGAKISSTADFSHYSSKSRSELRLLYCQYWMPARFLDVVASSLNQRFQKTLNNPSEIARKRLLYLINLDDAGIEESIEPNERPSLMKPLQFDKEFTKCVNMLTMLMVSRGSKSPAAVKQPHEDAAKKCFFIAEAVLQPADVVPAYVKYAWSQLRTPRPETSAHANGILKTRVSAMPEDERKEFLDAYDAETKKLADLKGPVDAEVLERQDFRKYIVKTYNENPYVAKKD